MRTTRHSPLSYTSLVAPELSNPSTTHLGLPDESSACASNPAPEVWSGIGSASDSSCGPSEEECFEGGEEQLEGLFYDPFEPQSQS